MDERMSLQQGTWVVALHGEQLASLEDGVELEAVQYDLAVPEILQSGALRVDYSIGTPAAGVEIWAPWAWASIRSQYAGEGHA